MPADTTTIEATENGPYVVRGPCRLRDARGEDVATRATFALCRCGNSSKKPFCDGTHARVGFSGDCYATGPADPPDEYRGKRVTILDARAICAHAGVCTDNLPAVFRLGTEPWIAPDGAELEKIIEQVKACPSGALHYAIDGLPASAEPRERRITASKNGPYFVSGDVKLEADGAQPRFAGRYALCRCGGSKNKPFCDGTHWAIEFDAARGQQRGVVVPPLGVRRFSLVCGALLVGGAAAVTIAIKALGLQEAPGLGPGGLTADLNLALELLLVAGLTFGYWLAKRGNLPAHRYNQTIWVVLNTLLVALIMAGSMQGAAVKGAADLARPNIWVPWLHAALGAATVGAGWWLVLQMNGVLPKRLHVRAWKTLMRIALAGYWSVALLGLAIYYLWYM